VFNDLMVQSVESLKTVVATFFSMLRPLSHKSDKPGA
jgi:hypothetical protein